MNETISLSRMPKLYFSHKEEYDESFLQSAKSASEFGGECVNSLESELCKKFNRKYAVATLTGTMALYLAYRCARILSYKNVLMPSWTHPACIDQALANGHDVFLNDIQTSDCSMKLENKFAKFDADILLSVGLFGHGIDYDSIQQFQKKQNIKFLINDAAQNYGSLWEGTQSCSYGDIVCLSFDAKKLLTSPFGQGGMCLTDSQEIYEILKSLIKNGKNKESKYLGGTNGFMPNIIASGLLVTLKYLDKEICERKRISKIYSQVIQKFEDSLSAVLPTLGADSVYQKYPFLCTSQNMKNDITRYMKEQKIVFSKVIPHNPLPEYNLSSYSGEIYCDSYENARYICDRILSFPISSELTNSQIEYICGKMNDYFSLGSKDYDKQ